MKCKNDKNVRTTYTGTILAYGAIRSPLAESKRTVRTWLETRNRTIDGWTRTKKNTHVPITCSRLMQVRPCGLRQNSVAGLCFLAQRPPGWRFSTHHNEQKTPIFTTRIRVLVLNWHHFKNPSILENTGRSLGQAGYYKHRKTGRLTTLPRSLHNKTTYKSSL